MRAAHLEARAGRSSREARLKAAPIRALLLPVLATGHHEQARRGRGRRRRGQAQRGPQLPGARSARWVAHPRQI